MKLLNFLEEVKIDFSTLVIAKSGDIWKLTNRDVQTFQEVLRLKKKDIIPKYIEPYLEMNIVKIYCEVYGVMKLYVKEEK